MPLSPEPDLRGRVFAGPTAGAIDLVIGEKFRGFIHDPPENFAALAAGQIVRDRLLGNFVRRPGFQIEILAAAIDQQIAIAHTS